MLEGKCRPTKTIQQPSIQAETFIIWLVFHSSLIKTKSISFIPLNGSKSYFHRHQFWFVTFWFSSFFVSFFSPPTETSEEPLVDLSDVLNTDADILGMLGKPSSDSGASHVSLRHCGMICERSPIVGLLDLFTAGSVFSSKIRSIFAFTLLMIFVTFLSIAFLFIFNLIFSLFASSESRCACSAITIFFTHLIWFWVLVGLDFCPFQVDSSPPPFGKGVMAY